VSVENLRGSKKKTVKYTLISLPVLLAMPQLYAYIAYPAEYVNRQSILKPGFVLFMCTSKVNKIIQV